MLARISYEDSYEIQVSPDKLATFVRETTMRLRQAGIEEEPVLWVQFRPDY